MRIYVCVKQVPDTSGKVAVKEDGTLDRASMETIINPDDMAAMEAALQLKDETGCQVTAVTMGPAPGRGDAPGAVGNGGRRWSPDFQPRIWRL